MKIKRQMGQFVSLIRLAVWMCGGNPMKSGDETEVAQHRVEPFSANGSPDLQLDELTGLVAQAQLIDRIRNVMEQARFSEESAANVLGISAPELVAALRRNGMPYPANQLFYFLNILSRAARWGRFEGWQDPRWMSLQNVLCEKPKTVDEIATAAGLDEDCAAVLAELTASGFVIQSAKDGKEAYRVSPQQLEVERLRAENHFLKQSLVHFLFKDKEVELDYDSLMKQCAGQPPLAELIKEL
jgi:predicted XRE-type DNA-binding protein